jgi:hypothetical protein
MHKSWEEADKEAQRLCRKENENFVVMEARTIHKTTVTYSKERLLEPLPVNNNLDYTPSEEKKSIIEEVEYEHKEQFFMMNGQLTPVSDI